MSDRILNKGDERASRGIAVAPMDRHNRELVDNVHPPDWVNPRPEGTYNLVVIGAGTAGLVAAAGAAGLGAKVALVERHLMGGDCLNVGCVPSKVLIASARNLAAIRRAGEFGIRMEGAVAADFPAVMERLRRLRAGISGHDSAERFRRLGVDVFLGEARFLDGSTVEVDGRRLRFKRAVIATGARAAVPPIPGLAEAGFLTNESLFSLAELPRRLAVIGGGPIGCEMAQAFRRLGSEVTLLTRGPRLLPREDPDASHVLGRAFEQEGIRVVPGALIERVDRVPGAGGRLRFRRGDGSAGTLGMDAVLVAVGRVPNVEGLGLERAGVDFDPAGVRIDDFFRTTNRRIFAAGDVAVAWQFTHAADFAARAVIRNALFFGRRRLSALTIPRCTYTAPEIAHVGLSADEAAGQGIEAEPFVQPMAEIDRAIADGEAEGFVKVLVRRGSDRIVGATVVSAHAGEMISEISVAMAAGTGLGALSEVIHPYPTRSEAIRKVGDTWNRTRLTPRVRRWMTSFLAWRRTI